MDYRKMISVTGFSGLFELVSSKNDGAIVKGLEDGVTRFVSSRSHQFSHLESIEVFTYQDNVNLVTVFEAMQASDLALPEVKDAKALRVYFEQVFPDMDMERVYASDMKKMIKWFIQLKSANIAIQLSANATEDLENQSEPSIEANP